MASRPAQAKQKSSGSVATKTRSKAAKRCGLCGKTRKLVRTECCNQWICDDESNYVVFSYARNSCSRNHRRYTLCGTHSGEQHAGRWQDCAKCRADIEPEMYGFYGTNEYNFEKLAEVPPFEPTRCGKCKRVIRLAEEGYTMTSKGYECSDCYSF